MRDIINKLGQIIDKRQKIRIVIIMFMMLISGSLETIGVSIVIPIISLIIEPEKLMDNRWVQEISRQFGMTESRQVLIAFLILMMLIYILKNVFIIDTSILNNV